jgi:peptide/nickel transport system ATP-binding protein
MAGLALLAALTAGCSCRAVYATTSSAHPYTRRLLESLPSPGGEIRDIPGEVPSLVGPPPGCRFHPRCDYATAECATLRPAAHAVEGLHRVRCYHPVGAA